MALTIEQVQQAGRFAWHPNGQTFIDGKLYKVMLDPRIDSDDDSVESYGTFVAVFCNIGNLMPVPWLLLNSVRDWYHVQDCDCEFCKP